MQGLKSEHGNYNNIRNIGYRADEHVHNVTLFKTNAGTRPKRELLH